VDAHFVAPGGACAGLPKEVIAVEVPQVRGDVVVRIGRAGSIQRDRAPFVDEVGPARFGRRRDGDFDLVVFNFSVRLETASRADCALAFFFIDPILLIQKAEPSPQ